ncbi:hypothetical protein OS493_002464 [Desmophyllum pertusum]|uniref:Uncharacterized protein n=1 Tax=Desmophyllum pertusum TaxID=174260 RepID=A0A9W9YT33_9CNID|nr:hypothetical protein OS493_002464 [Desmophyllum pertusum]
MARQLELPPETTSAPPFSKAGAREMERKGRVEEDHEDDASKRAKLSFEEEEEEAPLAILEKVEDGCRECFKENWSNYIRTCHQVKEKTVDIYNYRLQNQGAELEEVLRHVFRQKRNAFKVNLAFGFILKNVETGEVRYFYPSQNGFVFDAPFLITNDADLDAFLEKIKRGRLVGVSAPAKAE